MKNEIAVKSPKVYLVGQSEVREDELQRFLDDSNVSKWATDTEVGGEILSEAAGRLCYMSYASPRPGGNLAYLKHIKESGHGSVTEHSSYNLIITGVSRALTHELVRHRSGTGYCLAGDTAIYSGSKCNGRYEGVAKKWTIKQLYDWSNDVKRKGRLKLIKVRCYDGEQFVQAGIKSISFSGVKQIFRVELADGKYIRCSLDHRFLSPSGWVAIRYLDVGDCLGVNGLPSFNLKKDELYNKYHTQNQTLDEIANYYKCSKHTVRKWLRVHGLQKPHGTGMTGRTPPNKGKQYKTGYRHTEETKKLIGDQKRGEKNPHWKGDFASKQAGRLRAYKLYPTEPCVVCGNPKGHRHHIDRNTLNNKRSNIEFLCNSCHKYRHLEEDGNFNCLRVKWSKIISIIPDGIEDTYDIEIDHPSHNFVANGFVTHNSQLSQRFVDESVAEYVVPPDLALEVECAKLRLQFEGGLKEGLRVNEFPKAYQQLYSDRDVFDNMAEAGKVWLDTVTFSHNGYVALSSYLTSKANKKIEKCPECGKITRFIDVNVDGKFVPAYTCIDYLGGRCDFKQVVDKTANRKFARQAARSVLPNACETKIFVTFNTRSARHFIEQRCSRHADTEIRKVAGMVYETLLKASPNMFCDYRRVELPDGTFEVTTDYKKV